MKTILAIVISLSIGAPLASASERVFTHGTELGIARTAGDVIATFPDVMISPPQRLALPPGVPIPYPNIGQAGATTMGAEKIRLQGTEVMLQNRREFERRAPEDTTPEDTTIEPGRSTQGRAYFQSYSFDVKFEGHP